MDEKQRRLDEIRRERSELENHVIDSYAAGKISRREFVRRGTVIGMSIPLLGFLASACGGGDDGGEAAPPAEPAPAESAPPPAETGTPAEPAAPPAQAGGALRTGIIAPAIELNPLVVYDEGGLAVLGQSGEYLTWTNEALELEPRLAESWDAERRRLRVDVQDPPGSHVPRRDASHRQRCRLHPESPCGPGQRGQRALGLRRSRRALGGRREGRRRRHGRGHAQRAERQLPVPGLGRQLQPHRRSRRLRPDDVGAELHRHGPVGSRHVHAPAGRHVHEEPELLGHDPPADRRHQRAQVLRRGPGADPRDPGRRGRHPEPVPGRRRRGGAPQRPEHRRDRGEGGSAPADPHACRPGALRRQAGPPGHGAPARPAGASSPASSRTRPTSGTTIRSLPCIRSAT